MDDVRDVMESIVSATAAPEIPDISGSDVADILKSLPAGLDLPESFDLSDVSAISNFSVPSLNMLSAAGFGNINIGGIGAAKDKLVDMYVEGLARWLARRARGGVPNACTRA